MTQAIVACARCGHILGTTSGDRLFVGGAVINRPTRIYCSKCDAKRTWRPRIANQTLDSVPITCPE